MLFKASHAFQESQSRFFAKLNEQLFNVRFIKLHSLFNHFISRLNDTFFGLLKNALRYQHTSYVFNGLDQLVVMVAQMILLLIGGREIIAGRLTIGRFVIISAYFNMMLDAIRYFFSLGQSIQSNLVSYSRLQELAKINPEGNGAQKLSSINSIEIKNLSFAYDSNVVFKNMDLKFEKGCIYAILGPNGAGKSTLLDIIMGLQVGNFTGQVLYNGISMEDIDMYDLRGRLLGVSEQEPILLADTLKSNLDLNQKNHMDFDSEKISDLVNMLGLETYLKTLSAGFDTIINESAVNLSGGEKQKLSILRTLIKNPDILILDEPTSALDYTSCGKLKKYLREIKKDKIIIVITHDSDFVNSQDTVVQL